MRITFPNPLGPPISFDTANIPSGPPILSRLTSHPRRAQIRVLLLILISLLLLSWRPSPPFPPDYAREWSLERTLPKSYNRPLIEGKEGRYIKFESPKPTGFNHQMQRVLLQHHLAVLSNRSYAYEPLVQDDTRFPFVLTFPPWRSARVPLSALISTVTSGFERFFDNPRAVPYSHYRSICPSWKETVYQLKDADHPDGNLDVSLDAQMRVHQLQALFAGNDAKCLRIQGPVFGDDFFDSESLLQLQQSFIQSPVLQHFTMSPTVLSVVNREMHRLAPDSAPYDLTRVGTAFTAEGVRPGSNWKHILALHLRHGDSWSQTCHDKGMKSAPFVGWTKIPEFPGNENVPPPADMAEAARLGLYKAKCSPDTLDIIARARRMRKNHPFLHTVYILTDGVTPWGEEVKMWLLSEGWENVWLSPKDIWPDWQDGEIGVGVDMEVARRSGVFVGNGFSTTGSNIALLRLRDGIHPDLTQFW
ncbi:hypothetical protein BD324DRAFT_649072 [Kockovaella imperatae]|uniref:GDP-fucose protein O-fucosyltransferase-domain-containing protein n=1 Tax=Kockovaella imperatae TaxID=4999 RepID=A0A1Y1UNB0_9TREE|nr:hypothetical protein BD324DRAFT_649072 [Kockovaella imperatae]ORX38974.1 hypothetical protein BD324DRAFT_649072 [Kockovaella imperatae]